MYRFINETKLKMKPNQIEKEILEKFDETFELSLDNDDSILFTIRNYGEKNYENATEGMSLIKQFISDSLSTYRTQVEKATLQAIKDKMPKEKQIKCNNTHIIAGDKPIKVCYNCASDGGFNYCRSQMLEIIEKMK